MKTITQISEENNSSYIVLGLLTNVVASFNLKITHSLKTFGITQLQFLALKILVDQDQQKIIELSGKIFTTHANMTHVVDGLEKLGCIERSFCKKDRRVIHICITSKGKELYAAVNAKYSENINSYFSSLSDVEQKKLNSILEKIDVKE